MKTHQPKQIRKPVIIICGPTASGKTGLSIKIAEEIKTNLNKRSQVINADIGQFYKPMEIGTAKPKWQEMPIKHNLFDIINKPVDLNSFEYKNLVIKKTNEIKDLDEVPIIVGGSMFYVQSMFLEINPDADTPVDRSVAEKPEELWAKLNEIDPERAKNIHPNDKYRVKRAIDIWKETGKKPSLYRPKLIPPFDFIIVFINTEREELYKRIEQRTDEMFENNAWINETRALKNTEWEAFLKQKKLIGYPEILEWLDTENLDSIPELIKTIKKKTRHYAKRQITFWKKLRKLLLEEKLSRGNNSDISWDIIEITDLKESGRKKILNTFERACQR